MTSIETPSRSVNEKPLVLYHAHCWDGFCAAWVARKALHDIEAVPVQYGQTAPDVTDRVLYVLDFAYPRDAMAQMATVARRTVVLDHHQTAMEALDGLHQPESGIDVWFDMTKSGGRMAWDWFTVMGYDLPTPNSPRAPWLVDYTEDRDLWRHRLPGSEDINAALRSYPLDFELWDALEQRQPAELSSEGQAIRRRERQIIKDHLHHAQAHQLDGHMGRSVNATVLFSEIAGELAKGYAFGACYFDRADGKRQWSLRSTAEGVDVSVIAKAHGGGGHPHAAGYEERR